MKILVADDDLLSRGLLENTLTEWGYEVLTASDGAEAWQLLRKDHAPRLAVLDWVMPGMEGLEVCRKVRERTCAEPAYLILLTARSARQDVVTGLEAGADDYITKPFDRAELRARLHVGRRILGLQESLAERLTERDQQMAARQRAEQELRKQQEWLQETLSSIGDAVIATDAEGCVLFMNPVAESMTGWTQTEARARPLEQIFRIFAEDTREVVESPVRRALRERKTQVLANHTVLMAKDGSERPIHDTGAPIRDAAGRIHGAVLVFHDVSETRKLEQALHDRAEKLAHADQRKDEFLAMLGHELRNPLTPIRNAVHLLHLRAGDRETVEQVRSMLDRQVLHVTRLVDDLLDVSRITRGNIQLRREPLDLVQLVRSQAEDSRAALEAAGLVLEVELPETPVWVLGDPARLVQVLSNLVENATKFTDPGGQVTVRLLADCEANQAVLSVRDTGIGIEPEMKARVFDIFAQADRSLDRSQGGLGLGLALVKGLVELHGGTVQAASEGKARGAEFSVRLPQVQEAAAPPPPPPPAAPGQNARILLIEDNRDTADSLGMFLELLGHEVTVAYSGPDGLQAAKRARPDVVVCDIGLPGIDGYAVARALRQNAETAGACLIAVTGYGQEEDRRRALEAGFDEHLVKPLDPNDLIRQLDPSRRGRAPQACMT